MTRKPTYEELEQRVKELKKFEAERKQAEEVLRESEEKYRSTFRAERDAIMVFDDETFRFIEANDATLDLYGYTKEEFLKLTPVDISAEPEETNKAVKKIVAHLPIDEYGLLERKHKRKDGTIFMAEISTSSFILGSRNMICGIVRDATKRVRTEEALRESEERFRNVYGTAPLAFMVWDIDARVTDWNKKAEEVFGWTKEEVVGYNFFDFLIPEKDRPHVADIWDRLISGEFQSHSINDNLTKEGKIITCEWNNTPLHDRDGNIIGAISLGLDITERKRIEEEREKLIKELQEALKEIKTLRGILPLCSFCKKIRDDKGYWEQVDVYIHKHSQADISHSLCPECAKEHYPDLDIHE